MFKSTSGDKLAELMSIEPDEEDIAQERDQQPPYGAERKGNRVTTNTPLVLQQAAQQGNPNPLGFLSRVTTEGRGLPSRIVLYGVTGIGKTSMFCYAPDPVFLQAEGETGLDKLLDMELIPPTPHLPEITQWETLTTGLQRIISGQEKFPYRTIVFDALGGFERICHEHVCEKQFGGNWGPDGFASWGKGYKAALVEWRSFLASLDRINRMGVMIVLIAHSTIYKFGNPGGEPYDRYIVDANEKTWRLTEKWADIVLFANYHTTVEKKDGKARAAGGKQRKIYPERTAAYDAKNRHGLSAPISMGSNAKEAWTNLAKAMKQGKKAEEARA